MLRIAYSIRRSEILIEAEAEWIRYLASTGVSVVDAVIQRSFVIENLKGCFREFMEGRAERIENAVPYLDLEFMTFASCLK